MDEAVVGAGAIVAACAFVKAGMLIPPRSLAVGAPARVLRPLSEQELEWKKSGTRSYRQLTVRSLATLREVAPLAAVEPDRRRFSAELGPDIVPLASSKRAAGAFREPRHE
jgi:phenylacetic acid degradation protein